MREILFRAKSICADTPSDTSNNYWIEGSLVHQTDHYGDPVDVYHIVKLGNFHCDFYDSEEVWPETVGQYTGLTVPSGKIFEHDVVTAKFKSNGARFNFLVEYSNAKGNYVFDNGRIKVSFDELRSVRILGNMHDNPELLKGALKICD